MLELLLNGNVVLEEEEEERLLLRLGEDVEEVEEIEMEGEVRVGVALLFVGDAVSKFKIATQEQCSIAM